MDNYLAQYQSANLTNEEVIRNFIVRKKEFDKVISSIKSTDRNTSFQHYVFVGRRGSGKSTLLRRIQAEVCTHNKLKKEFIVINLSEEQAGIYKLYDLWDYVIRDLQSKGHIIENLDWQEYQEDLKEYTKKLYAKIHTCLDQIDKRLILLIDNIDRIFKNIGKDANLLREQLMNYNDVRVIGGSTIMSEDYWRYDMPFYQFFAIKKLEALTLREIKQLLQHWSKVKDLEQSGYFLQKHPGKIQAIRMLTDGTPRTMQLFVDMMINRPEQNGFDYLRKIIDHATPIYQERLGTLSPQQQKILTELSFFWEASPIENLISVCKMPGKTISAQLNQLIKSRMVEKVKGPTKNHFYRLEERFFNLWLLMTQGGPKQKRDAKYLTIFIENWYDQNEIKEVYDEVLGSVQSGNIKSDYAASMVKALAHSRYISLNERDEILEKTLALEKLTSNLKDQLPELSAKIFSKGMKLAEKNEFQEAIQVYSSIEQEDEFKNFALGALYYAIKNYELAKEHFLKAAIEKRGDVYHALGLTYEALKNIKEAERYYLKAIEQGDKTSFYNIGQLYERQNENDKAIMFYEKSAESGEKDAILKLANMHLKLGKLEEAELNYKKATELNIESAHAALGIFYLDHKKQKLGEKELIQGTEANENAAHLSLATYYYNQNLNPKKSHELVQKAYSQTPHNYITLLVKVLIDLWTGKMSSFLKERTRTLETVVEKSQNWTNVYLQGLLVHKQYQFVLDQFEKGSLSEQLKSKYLPIYYATISLTNPDDQKLIKIAPELTENVQDIIQVISKRQELYYGKSEKGQKPKAN